ncbi:ABC transporter permease [Streptomyces minutiscleroticus]|uniref:ABC transporter permease n=1 Tax=Streptomyces minutiscleroticus TaxID=68238 RepID=UPI001E3DD80A|nr:ABC transporter permease [Streptomyces minutiscleroticus]
MSTSVEPSQLHWRDLLSESLAGMLQRPARSALTSVGTVLGVGTFVAVLGLTATASTQINERFNVLSATEVTVESAPQDESGVDSPFPVDADQRVKRLNGVEHAGIYWPVQLDQTLAVHSAPVNSLAADTQIRVVAASSGVLEAAEPLLTQGSLFNTWHDDDAQRVAVIGTGMAARLGITTLETQPAIFIGDEAFSVVGIIDNVRRKADLLLSVVIPRSTAEEMWGPPASDVKMIISTRLGAAAQVAAEAPIALDAAHPDHYKVIPPPDPKALRTQVTGDLDQLFMLLAFICLFVGAVGIANTTLVAVLERTGEIGLRRALGARGHHIAAQFLVESGILGALGGLIGTTFAILTIASVALARNWTPVIDLEIVAAAPLLGWATGLLAGLYPAWRASRIQPIAALRR